MTGEALSPQARRDLLLMAWLDVTLETFLARVRELDEAGLIDDLPEAVNDYATRYIGALQVCSSTPGGDPEASQLMMQAVAGMADDTLLEAVRLFGVVPAGVEG